MIAVAHDVCERVLGLLPPAWHGRAEYYLRLRSAFRPFDGPLNSQLHRRRIVDEIFSNIPVSTIVETGTFRGVTTEFFATFGLPVFSIELNPRFYEFSKLRLKDFANVTLLQGNSPHILMDLVQHARIPESGIFFYLDAHCHLTKCLPLAEELKTVFNYCQRSVVMVDDFQVPGDSGYRFDDYGNGKRLSKEFLRDLSNDFRFSLFFPSVPSEEETGCKIGCAIITSDVPLTATMQSFQSISYYGDSSAL